MADISADFWTWSSTAASNSPSGSTAVGTGLDDNLRAIQAAARAAQEPLSAVAGTNTITATMANITAYASGMRVRFIPANSNTGATTINVSALGAKNIFLNGVALVGYELRKNTPVELYYDGTQFNIIAGAHGGDGVPIGTVKDRGFGTVPNGYLQCDGSAVSRTTYADLFAVLGTTWGVGDGSTTFNLPSLARRVAVGSGGSATSTLSNTVGSTGGEETHLLTGAESGTSAHSHTMFDQSGATGSNGNLARWVAVTIASNATGQKDTDVATAANASSAHNNMQPSAVMLKVIKY